VFEVLQRSLAGRATLAFALAVPVGLLVARLLGEPTAGALDAGLTGGVGAVVAVLLVGWLDGR
jgi:hypothetical protein